MVSVYMKRSSEKRNIVIQIWNSEPFLRQIMVGAVEYFQQQDSWVDFSKRFTEEPYAVDGFVVAVTGLEGSRDWENTHGIVVNVSNHNCADSFPSVTNDDYATGKMAAEYFLAQGHQHFGVYHRNTFVFSQERRKGYIETLREAGHECLELNGSHVLPAYLREAPRPMAIFATEDEAAQHIYVSAHKNGVQIPEDFAILAVNNDPVICGLMRPSLSSIVIDQRRIGYEAALLLDRMLRGEVSEPKPRIRIPPLRVEERLSTNPIHYESVLIGRAAQLMIANIEHPLSINEIAFRLGVERRTLEREFRRHLDITPLHFYLGHRMGRAKRLLATTDETVANIATKCGYPDYARFAKAFSAEVGTAPGSWRTQHGEVYRAQAFENSPGAAICQRNGTMN